MESSADEILSRIRRSFYAYDKHSYPNLFISLISQVIRLADIAEKCAEIEM